VNQTLLMLAAPARWSVPRRVPSGLEPMICPWCVRAGAGIPCRAHLAAGEVRPDRAMLAALAALREPLKRCIGAMTSDGPTPTPEYDAALVAALGWFAGWRPALELATQR